MTVQALIQALPTQTGVFVCRLLDAQVAEKTVPFEHLALPPVPGQAPAFGRLPEFYEACGGVVFFSVPGSQEAARRLLPPPAWPALHAECAAWFDGLSEAEWSDCVPEPLWQRDAQGRCTLDALVIGDTPHSGNYVLMAARGPQAGQVYEFDHDGFEFTSIPPDIVAYAQRCLNPDASRLLDYASHLRFVEDGDYSRQWVARQLRWADGRVIDLE